MSKLKQLQIDINDLSDFRTKETLLYARCGITGKELRITCQGGMQVWKDGKVVFEHIQPYPVVEFFNAL